MLWHTSCNLSLSGNNQTSTAYSLARWCSHCGCGSCPTPSSSALCLPCAAGHCGHGGLMLKTSSRAPGGAHDPGDGPGPAFWCHYETSLLHSQQMSILLWCHPGSRSYRCGYQRLCCSLAPPAGRLLRGGGGHLRHRWSQWRGIHKCPHQMVWPGRGGVYGRCCFPQPSRPDI